MASVKAAHARNLHYARQGSATGLPPASRARGSRHLAIFGTPLALSLNQKRKAMILCLDALNTLRQAILEEPIAGVTYGRPPSPR